MKQLDEILSIGLSLHSYGKHEQALVTIARYSGNWKVADSLGKKLNHKSFRDAIIDNIFYPSPLLKHLETV
jgi:hypothetical protein